MTLAVTIGVGKLGRVINDAKQTHCAFRSSCIQVEVLDLQRALPHSVTPIGVVAITSSDTDVNGHQRFDVESCDMTVIGNNTNHPTC